MPEFLSDAWLEQLDRSLAELGGVSAADGTDAGASPDRSAPGSTASSSSSAAGGIDAGAASEVIVQVTIDAAAGPVTYHLVVRPDRVAAVAGAAEAPDLVLHQDVATASAIARGELTARTALADGRLRLSGDPGALLAHAPRFADLEAATAALRDETTFPEG